MDSQEATNDATKRGPFDSLSHDELVTKCKQLLTIAKNAKQAKDDCRIENATLKESIAKFETQKVADKQCLAAMQEVIDSLTAKELNATTEIDKLQRSLAVTNEQLQTMVNNSIENESMKRRIKQLTDENEEILKDLENCEKELQAVNAESLKQNKQLLQLEETTTKWAKLEMLHAELNRNFQLVQAENEELRKAADAKATFPIDHSDSVVELKKELDNIKVELQSKQDAIKEYEHLNEKSNQTAIELNQMKHELNEKIQQCKEQEKNALAETTTTTITATNSKSNSLDKQLRSQAKKLNLYKTKILEFSTQLKQLRLSKEILSKTVNEYSRDVSKWQIEIVTVSNKLFEKIQSLQIERNTSMDKIRVMHEEHAKTMETLNECNQCIIELRAELQQKQSEIDVCKSNESKYKELQIDYEKLMHDVEEQNCLIEKSKRDELTQCDGLNAELDRLGVQLEKQMIQNDHLKDAINTFKMEITEKDEFIRINTEQLESLKIESQHLLQEKSVESQQVSNLQESLKDLQHQLDAIVNEKLALQADINKSLQRKANESDELLNEMRELNEALKNRGDMITKQTDKITELEQRLDVSQKKIHEQETICGSKATEIIRLTGIINDFERASVTNDTVSVSSISRGDEISRMRDIEDSFEEKYNKLKGLAVKLKKKVAEQTAIITKLETDHNQATNDGQQINTKLGAIEVHVRNLQLLQNENDKLQDRIDLLTADKHKDDKKMTELNETISRLTDELADVKITNVKNQNVVSDFSKTKLTLEDAVKEYTKQIQSLKNECNSINSCKKDLEMELTKTKEEILLKERDEVKLKAELNKMKSSMKSTNVLNLEMEAYEKSLKDISQKLEDRNSQIAELQATIKTNDNSMDALRNQILILESGLKSEEDHSMDLKQQIDLQQIKLKESEHEKMSLTMKLDDLTRDQCDGKIELENVRLNAEQNAIEREKIVQLLQTENEKNVRQVSLLTDELGTIRTKLRDAEQEVVDLKTEFASYKVKAQMVLRQNQSNETSRENELEDELSTMRMYLEKTKTNFQQANEQNEQLANELTDLKCDKERLHAKCKELLELLDESRSQTELMHIENQKQHANHQEVLKAQRLQIDTLNSCYKNQIVELEDRHKNALDELNKVKALEIDAAGSNVADVAKGSVQMSTSIDSNRIGMQLRQLTTDEQKIDWILTERQEGEGSENTSTSGYMSQRKISATRVRRDFIPLDELLNNSMDETVSMTELSVSPSIELQITKDKLHLQESRVRHLTALLAEAEQDLAKLTQLNDVLKEEMRRNERSTEREKHLHNLEYLKNVVFKFLTINNGDEKTHLVPVLNTILKLSPEETQKLQACARGESGSKIWSNYLPKWSNNNNNNNS